jgi:hypothetical protein
VYSRKSDTKLLLATVGDRCPQSSDHDYLKVSKATEAAGPRGDPSYSAYLSLPDLASDNAQHSYKARTMCRSLPVSYGKGIARKRPPPLHLSVTNGTGPRQHGKAGGPANTEASAFYFAYFHSLL